MVDTEATPRPLSLTIMNGDIEPLCVTQGPDGKRSWHNILEAAGKTRPTLLETVYGLDVIIPGEQHCALHGWQGTGLCCNVALQTTCHHSW